LEAIKRARLALDQPDAFLFIEACSVAELDLTAEADRLFALVGDDENPMLVEHRVRHLLRAGRADEAAKYAESQLGGQLHDLVLPYATIAWRLIGDGRWDAIANQPDLLGVYDIVDLLPPLDQLTDVLNRLHLTQHEPLEQSLRGGTQTDGPLLSNVDPAIQHLRRALVTTVREHASKISRSELRGDAALDDLRFAGSWSVLLRGQGHHANHIHQAGWISSALYISLPHQNEMGSPPAGWFTLGQPPAELKTGLDPIRTIEPKPGRLVLFPSTMWHGTNPIESGTRLTVAFDIAPLKTSQ
jgi:Putative 2OG-Fe(II) oxygenase